MDNKERFLKLCTDNIHRQGVDEFLAWLQETDFFTAPASTKYHSACEGGLVGHSLQVFDRLIAECELEKEVFGQKQPTLETLTIAALLHDVCKARYYKATTRNVKNEQTGAWEKQPYYAVENKFAFGHGEKSVFLIERHMRLTITEAQAIRFHMGEFESDRETGDAYAVNPLAVLLHLADMKATYLYEKQGINIE